MLALVITAQVALMRAVLSEFALSRLLRGPGLPDERTRFAAITVLAAAELAVAIWLLLNWKRLRRASSRHRLCVGWVCLTAVVGCEALSWMLWASVA